MYTGTADNPNFLPRSLADTADVIAGAVGPSGPNPDYLFSLQSFLSSSPSSSATAGRGGRGDDPYLDALAALVRQRLPVQQQPPPPQQLSSTDDSFVPDANLRGCFAGSGGDALREPDVFEAIVELAKSVRRGGANKEANSGGDETSNNLTAAAVAVPRTGVDSDDVAALRVLYIGTPTYDLPGCVPPQ